MAYTLEKKKARTGWIFVLPACIFFAVFSFYPIANALYASFCRKSLISLTPPVWVGLANYKNVLSSAEFWNSVRATAVFSFGAFMPLVLVSLTLAVFLTTKTRRSQFLQLVYYSPALLSSVVAALIWKIIFEPRGLANQAANFFAGTRGVDFKWLSDSLMLQISTITVYVWKYVGYFTILFITGLSKIPESMYEAAAIDGAGEGARFFRITLPLLRPTTTLVSVIALLNCLKTFSTQYLFTQSGSPRAPVNVISLTIYNTAMREYDIGRASVMSVLLFLFMLVLTIIQLRASGEKDL